MKIKRIKKKNKAVDNHITYTASNVPERELLPSEIERGIEDRLRHIENSYVERVTHLALDSHGEKEAIRICKENCVNSGSASDGFWVSGRNDGIHIEVFHSQYTKNRGLVAKGIIPYKQVVAYLVEKRERETEQCQPKKKRKIRRKSS